jgi:hypothetical protein
VAARAADPTARLDEWPDDLPPAVNPRQRLWRASSRRRWRWREFFALPAFSGYDAAARRRIQKSLWKRRRQVRGWIAVVLGQEGADPTEILRSRLRDVIRRADLWSDEILALRVIQSLTILDVYHYCQLVWRLGGYEEDSPGGFNERLPFPPDEHPASDPSWLASRTAAAAPIVAAPDETCAIDNQWR